MEVEVKVEVVKVLERHLRCEGHEASLEALE
jgi:hypothetical protein